MHVLVTESLGSLLPIIAVIIIVMVFSRKSNNPAVSPEMTTWQLQQRNQEWLRFIEGYDQIAKTPAEKQLVRRMLYDAFIQGLGTSELASQYKLPKGQKQPEVSAEQPLDTWQQPEAQPAYAYAAQPAAISKPIDNASLLLYFGAFLFVASVGLFVAFGGATPTLRAVAVLLVMAVMYGGGLWLYKNKPRLQQAGLAFAAIGIVIAPLVGLAFYSYIFNQQHGAAVWLLTSLFCLGLYAHALVTLKKPLISYLLIFTFLSLFESGVSIATAPVYYFGWGLAFVGIILQALSQWRGYYPELKESSRYSSMALLPIAVVTSLALLPKQGSGQLGVSLLLAAAFYGLEAMSTKGYEQETNAIVSQSTVIAAAASIAYAASHRWIVVVISLLMVNVAQVLVMVLANVSGRLWQNFGSVLLAASVVDVLLALSKPESLLAATAGAVVISVIIWWRQRRADAYGMGALAFMALPYLYGQINLTSHLQAGSQTVLGLMALLLLLVAHLVEHGSASKVTGWTATASASFALGAVSVAVASVFASPLLCLSVTLAIVASFILLAERSKQFDWADAAGLFLIVPLVRGWSDAPILLATVLLTLFLLIGMSLRYRREFLRWSSTVAWFLVPVALGRGVFATDWTAAEYAWAYVGVMAALIFSRAVARGVVLFSSKIPLGTYARSASLSYVTGYITAAVTAVIISLFSDSSRTHTTLILAVLTLVTLFVGSRVEKKQDIVALVPLLTQGVLLSAIRPLPNGNHLDTFLLASTALAVVFYFGGTVFGDPKSKQTPRLLMQQAALVTAFIAPAFLLLFNRDTWPMALGLLVAGLLLVHYLRHSQQTNRELAGAVITLSLLWFLGLAHVHAVQAYAHLIIANLALYAYWRFQRGEREASDSYLWAMLTTATAPLALQAMSGAAGGLYGWWLLLEQIVFMLLGMSIKRRFVTMWGLYTAVAAVLFQLRHLGWAALTILALFLIGLAVFQLQKHNDQN